MQFHILTAILLFLLGIATSFISTNTGGGALISIPALILFGFQPIAAIATVKFGHFGTLLSGLYRFHKNKTVKYRTAIPAAISASMGAIIGANLLTVIPQTWLTKIISILILIVLLLTWLYNLGILPRTQHKNMHILGLILFSFIGVWGGILGAAGVFATFVLLTCFGLTFVETEGTRKLTGLCITIISLVIYAMHHLINYKYGLVLFCGTLIGSYIGAGFGIRKGNQWMRYTFSIVTLALAIKLLF